VREYAPELAGTGTLTEPVAELDSKVPFGAETETLLPVAFQVTVIVEPGHTIWGLTLILPFTTEPKGQWHPPPHPTTPAVTIDKTKSLFMVLVLTWRPAAGNG
jgi:hypothetical protein